MHTNLYNMEGEPVSFEEGSKLFSSPARILRRTSLKFRGMTIDISTVFLVMDHRVTGIGRPILWETMIFGGPPEIDQTCERYDSREEALLEHECIVHSAEKNGAIVFRRTGSAT